MRDRLVELLNEAHEGWLHYVDNCAFNQTALSFTFGQMFADHLLANGVIVPPCKVGDIVYSISRKALGGHWKDNRYIVDRWSEYKVCEIPFSLTLWECGWKNIFLTREEAEAKLKGEQ